LQSFLKTAITVLVQQL